MTQILPTPVSFLQSPRLVGNSNKRKAGKEAGQGIQEVSENVTQSADVANDIAQNISVVNQAATAMSENSADINTSAKSLSQLSGKLK